MRQIPIILACAAQLPLAAQCDRWQQRIKCDISVELNSTDHRYAGTELLEYTNNSPDTLRLLYFHLYPNAFRPGSAMDIRSRTIKDPDRRVADRISKLQPAEMGELTCSRIVQGGKALRTEAFGTILRVHLEKPLLPGKRTALKIDFNGQVPVQIRRSGRDNAEGVAYSMTQWYPKVCGYDHRGWNTDPYVGREFFGEWGDHTLTITMDSAFTIASTGVLKNAQEIGHGYAPRTKPQKRSDGRLTWKFSAPRVHDLAWAADRGYKHLTAQVPDGPLLRFLYRSTPDRDKVWSELPGYMVRTFQYMSEHFGRYPYPEYAFVQGGDGGMEYPMMTLITADRRLGSLVGVSVHECVHSWYQGVLASDEGDFPWMDEGFTEYASEEVMRVLFPPKTDDRPHLDALNAYLKLAASEDHEPMSTHADHFNTNYGYSTTAYSKGELFLDQLGTVVGDVTLHKGLRHLYNTCGFKHPEPVDVRRSMEKVSGLQLDWYFGEWINTIRPLDYAVKGVEQRNDSVVVTLERKGGMLMPVDVVLLDKQQSGRFLHIPLSLTMGARMDHPGGATWTDLPAWEWVAPTYTFVVPGRVDQLHAVVVDPFSRLADMDRTNDQLLIGAGADGLRND